MKISIHSWYDRHDRGGAVKRYAVGPNDVSRLEATVILPPGSVVWKGDPNPIVDVPGPSGDPGDRIELSLPETLEAASVGAFGLAIVVPNRPVMAGL